MSWQQPPASGPAQMAGLGLQTEVQQSVDTEQGHYWWVEDAHVH